jgi:hypothetical protein
MDNGYSLSDVASVVGNNGFGMGNDGLWIFALLILLFANGGFGGGDFGRYATSASQQEILFGQQFQNLDNKMDRLGYGICDSTFALNNSIMGEGRGLSKEISESTQKILDVMAQNKIESLQGQINQLQLQNAMCGVVRYPNAMSYSAGTSPFCNCGNGCGNI